MKKQSSMQYELLGGKPVDVHVLQKFLPEVDSFQIKSVIRCRVFRNIENLKRFTQTGKNKFNWGIIMIVALVVILLMVGILILMYYPQITAWLKGMFGGIAGGS